MRAYEGTGEAGVVFCDLPTIPAKPVENFIVQQMAAVAELDRGLISQRTKGALAAAKPRGVKLGGYRGVTPDANLAAAAHREHADAFAARDGPMILEMRQQRMTLARIAERMSADGIRTARGGHWTAMTVKSVLDRMVPPVASPQAVSGKWSCE